ncbi:MAG TPA: ABC transporter ATP-binding protein [Streptosporangiaceae bacterium]|nr:ABC transporter ATP-binding protein [Streptosporangiaceae bacterium]
MLETDAEVDRRDFTVRAALSVAQGERLALFGPSGAGKTTVLEMIAGLVQPRRALIMLGGRVLTSTGKPATVLPPWQRGVGLLRQDPGLFPHLTVRANLLYGRASGPLHDGSAHAAAAAELAELAGVLGIGDLLQAMPARLSGGQAHRVALGRLLLSHCGALLLDEPYTGLDANLRRTLTDLVVSLVAERDVPSILVAHELAEAQAFADRLAVLDRGEVLQTGAPGEVVLDPATRRVAELVGYASFVPAAQPPDAAARVAAIHPDRVVAGNYPERGLVLHGVITACRPAGALWEITVQTGDAVVTGRFAEPAPIGQDLAITALDPPVFGPDGERARSSAGGAAGEQHGHTGHSRVRR